MALTDATIRDTKPKAKSYRLYDERGLYLEVTPSGSKLFRYKYRFKGKEKRLALGSYPDVSLRTARGHRDDARWLLVDGIDPGQIRRAEKLTQCAASNTFLAIWREWLEKFGPTWSDGNRDRVTR
ncbi:MAG: Arm DNA-binding domain-containing protein [Pseudomonadota bacterium]